tara:strand:+ start:1217 stop:1720 length:504 start_codon:yes stop_codon:yes gene_type:complete
MPTDLTTLLDFETNVETAAKIFLSTATGLQASSLYATLDQDNLVLPRISVSFESSGAIDPVDVKSISSDQLEYRKYSGNFSIQVVSDASRDDTQAEHRTLRAQVRAAMLLNAENWTATDELEQDVLPYYDINYMRPVGTEYVIEGDLAISSLSYEMNLTIRNDQFPD